MNLELQVFTYAVIYDSAGNYVGKKRIDTDLKTFNFQGNTFLYRPKCKTYFKLEKFFYSYKYYFYNYDNAEPLEFRDNYEP